MSAPEFSILTLVPPSQTPAVEVLDASNGQSETFSDLFPVPVEPDGPLGDYYQDGSPSTGSPLLSAYRQTIAERKLMYAQNSGSTGISVEATRQKMQVAGLQSHLIRCIDKGYHNLRVEGFEPVLAVTRLGQYIIEKESQAADGYRQRLADADTVAAIAGDDSLAGHQAMLKSRLQRVTFERRTAGALLVILKTGIVV